MPEFPSTTAVIYGPQGGQSGQQFPTFRIDIERVVNDPGIFTLDLYRLAGEPLILKGVGDMSTTTLEQLAQQVALLTEIVAAKSGLTGTTEQSFAVGDDSGARVVIQSNKSVYTIFLDNQGLEEDAVLHLGDIFPVIANHAILAQISRVPGVRVRDEIGDVNVADCLSLTFPDNALTADEDGNVTVSWSALLNASQMAYAPALVGNWNAPPVTVKAGLDELAQRVRILESSVGVGGLLSRVTNLTTSTDNQTAFSIPSGVQQSNTLLSVGGLCQLPGQDYTISGTVLTLLNAPFPLTGEVLTLYEFTSQDFLLFTAVSDQAQFALPFATTRPEDTLLFVDGLLQDYSSDYTVLSTVMDLVSAPFPQEGDILSILPYGRHVDRLTALLLDQAQFTLSTVPTDVSKTMVSVEGLLQIPGVHYNIIGNQLYLLGTGTLPGPGERVVVVY